MLGVKASNFVWPVFLGLNILVEILFLVQFRKNIFEYLNSQGINTNNVCKSLYLDIFPKPLSVTHMAFGKWVAHDYRIATVK